MGMAFDATESIDRPTSVRARMLGRCIVQHQRIHTVFEQSFDRFAWSDNRLIAQPLDLSGTVDDFGLQANGATGRNQMITEWILNLWLVWIAMEESISLLQHVFILAIKHDVMSDFVAEQRVLGRAGICAAVTFFGIADD